MSETSVVIVDDEPPARARLSAMVSDLDGYRVIAEAINGDEAIEVCTKNNPDIVLLDIRMPGRDGLSAAQSIAAMEIPPAIVFCTAYDEYALQAFDANAIAYLLKPVKRVQLEEALRRAGTINRVQCAALAVINQSASDTEILDEFVAAKTHVGHERIPVSDIRLLMADQRYVMAHLPDREVLLDIPLKEFEVRYAAVFVRIHRNALVAKNYVQALEREGANNVLRIADIEARPVVSRRLLSQLRKLISGDR